MIIFPFQWITFETSLTRIQVKEKLDSFIDDKPGILDSWFRMTRFVRFYGYVYEDERFYLKRMTSLSGGYIVPYVFGKMDARSGKSGIKILIRPHLLFLIAFLIGITWSAWEMAIIYNNQIQRGVEFFKAFKSVLSVIGIYVIVVGSFKFYSYKTVQALKTLFEAEIVKNTY